MKKMFALFSAALLVIGGFAFAQDAEPEAQPNNDVPRAGVSVDYSDRETQYITIEDKFSEFHPKARTVTLEMEYTPMTGEVIVYYTCMNASFDQGEAMNTIDAVLEEFALENKFRNKPLTIKKDRSKYFKDGRNIKMATYRRWVKFTR